MASYIPYECEDSYACTYEYKDDYIYTQEEGYTLHDPEEECTPYGLEDGYTSYELKKSNPITCGWKEDNSRYGLEALEGDGFEVLEGVVQSLGRILT